MRKVVRDDCNCKLVSIKCMWFSGDRNWMCNHWSATVHLPSHNPIIGGTEDKYGINGRDSSKRGREWTNRKECGRFGDGWDCCLLAIIVSQ